MKSKEETTFLKTLKGVVMTNIPCSSSSASIAANGINDECNGSTAPLVNDLASNTSNRTRLKKKANGSEQTKKSKKSTGGKFEKCPLHVAVCSYVCYCIIFIVGFVRESLFGIPSRTREVNREGYAPLYASFESFYTRNVYRRIKDAFGHPISSVPGGYVDVVSRKSNDHFWSFQMVESEKKRCINLGSYNYLGFAESSGPVTEGSIEAIKELGLSNSSTQHELGASEIHKELEKTVSQFVGTESSITFGMGFATNSLNIPAIIAKKCLVLSDELNHASIILGLRLSGATVMVFKHNNMDNLERILRQAIIKGHPRTRRPWKKILIVVEGVYSMEGSIVKLPEIIALKKKYGAYVYLDEAHSVGAMGPNGRGVVDYYGLNPKDIDILMGTFTKSFGSSGGYIAGSEKLINYLRTASQGACYANSMSPPVAKQIIGAMKVIMHTEEGMKRVQRLASNSKYFRQRLQEMGFIVYGHNDSPVIPLLLFMPSKIQGFVREMMKVNIATVGVGFPATPITEERARFCISAGHTKEMLDQVLEAVNVIGNKINLKYSRRILGKRIKKIPCEYQRKKST